MTNCCPVGVTSKLFLETPYTSPTSKFRIDFLEFQPTRFVKILSDGSENVIRGTLDRRQETVDEGLLFVQFTIRMYLTGDKLDLILPLMGGSESSNVWTLGDTLPSFNVILDAAGSKQHTFGECYVNSWAVYGQKGASPVMLDLDVIGKTWVEATLGTYATANSGVTITEGYPFNLTRGAMSVLGSTRTFNQFRIGMDYKLAVEHMNSITATSVCPTDHDISVATSTLYSTCGSTTDLFTEPMGGDVSGDAFTLDFTRTANSINYQTLFTIANVKLIARPPKITKPDFIRLPINGKGYATAANAAMKITNVVS